MLRRMRAIARRETTHILRDPRSLAVAILLPVVMLVLYGYGINMDVRHIRTAVLDEDQTRMSREVTDAFERSSYFDVVARPANYRALDLLMDRSEVKTSVVLPRGFAADTAAGRGNLQLLVDGSDAATASIATGYGSLIVQAYQAQITQQEMVARGAATQAGTIDLRTRYWYNPEQKSNDFVVPGLAAVILMVLSALLTSLTIVRERERGTIEQIVVSPTQSTELIIGKLTPYVVLAFLDIVLVISGGRWLFNVPMRGSLVLLAFSSAVFLIAALSLGLLISCIANTQLMAMMAAVMVTMLPSVLLSGFAFPISTMPAVVQAVTYLVPARYYLVIVRGILLKGVGLDVLWPDLLSLLALAGLLIVASVRRFRAAL